jgi:hypothetical protein
MVPSPYHALETINPLCIPTELVVANPNCRGWHFTPLSVQMRARFLDMFNNINVRVARGLLQIANKTMQSLGMNQIHRHHRGNHHILCTEHN